MKNKTHRINLVVTESQFEKAEIESEKMFGRANKSGWIAYLIEKEKPIVNPNKTEQQLETLTEQAQKLKLGHE